MTASLRSRSTTCAIERGWGFSGWTSKYRAMVTRLGLVGRDATNLVGGEPAVGVRQLGARRLAQVDTEHVGQAHQVDEDVGHLLGDAGLARRLREPRDGLVGRHPLEQLGQLA